MDRDTSAAFEDLHAILRYEIFSRLITKLELALSRTPLDLDFLEFTCRQELYLFEALSRHVSIPVMIVQAFEEFFRLVMQHSTDIAVETVAGVTGRPRYDIDPEKLSELLEINLPLACIAKLIGVSNSTTNRRMREFGVSARQRYSTITDEELDNAVISIKNEMPISGYGTVKGRLRSLGIHVPWRRMTSSMHRVDSLGIISRLTGLGCIVRRAYSVKGPLSLWHVDSNHKLIRYNIVLFGAMDGYSRKVMCLKAATNNRAQTAFAAFEKATEKYGIPSRVIADRGVENVEIAHYMFTVRGTDRGSFISGKSVHSQRIERLWRDVRTCVTSKYYSLLHNLETDHLLDISSREDLFAVHMTFLPKLKADLEAFVEGWNNHPLRTEGNLTPEQLWHTGMMLYPMDQPENLEDIQEPDIDWDVAAEYGGHVDGAVVVPEFPCPLNEQQLAEVQLLLENEAETDTTERFLRCGEYVTTALSAAE